MKNKTIFLSGDKSISHRALMISSISKGVNRITNLCNGRDVDSTINCLRLCGAKIEKRAKSYIVSTSRLSKPLQPLNCGNSGTTIRLLSGLLAGQGIEAVLYGDDSLMSRPMDRIVDPLTQMGAKIENRDSKIIIKRSSIRGGNISNNTPSAQVKSSIILAGLGASNKTILDESYDSRDHTERMLSYHFRDSVYVDENRILISPSSFVSKNLEIPGDISKASFLIAYVCLLKGASITLKNVSFNPYRIGFIRTLIKMGADIVVDNKKNKYGEPTGDVHVRHSSRLKNIRVTAQNVRDMIDEIPILAVVASLSKGVMVIEGISELRLKESDRVFAIISNLKAMGVDVRENKENIMIKGQINLYNTNIKTFSDHRIAMAFYIASLFAKRTTKLDDLDCIDVSFPDFFDKIKEIAL